MDSNSLTSSLFRAKDRKVNENEDGFELREAGEDYHFDGKNGL